MRQKSSESTISLQSKSLNLDITIMYKRKVNRSNPKYILLSKIF